MQSEEKIRVIISNDSGLWVAQCLEHDICVQADDLDDIRGRFEVALRIEAEIHGGDLSAIGPAPQHFFDQWDRRAGSFTPTKDGSSSYEMALAA